MKRANPEIKFNFEYLLSLLGAVLNGTMPPKPVSEIDWRFVIYLAERHSVLGMLYYALAKLDKADRPNEKVMAYARQLNREQVVTDINFTVETQQLLSMFNEHKIKAIPLKGILLKNDYPSPEMRSMSDVDILVEADKQDLIYSLLKERGYHREHLGLKDVSYRKDKFLHFEMHSTMVAEDSPAYGYFLSVWDRAVFDKNSSVAKLTNEDFYIYMLEHLARHLETGGAGLRMIMDFYVFLSKYESSLDRAYVDKVLTELKLDSFEEKVRSLSFDWFGKEGRADASSDAAEFVLCSFTFGSAEALFVSDALKKDVTGKTKATKNGLGNIMKRIFPSFHFISYKYKWLKKLPVLYPVGVCAYWCERIFAKKDLNFKNLGNYFASADTADAKYLESVFEQFGLDKRM